MMPLGQKYYGKRKEKKGEMWKKKGRYKGNGNKMLKHVEKGGKGFRRNACERSIGMKQEEEKFNYQRGRRENTGPWQHMSHGNLSNIPVL
jgi:hypothetical protein